MMRVIYSHITANNPSIIMPDPTDPNIPLSRASTLLPGDADDYTGYTTARQQLAPFITPTMPDQLSQTLKRLRIKHRLHLTLKTWLTNLDSASTATNILWLLDKPTSTKISSILFSTLTSQDRPVLAFSCSHVDSKNHDITPENSVQKYNLLLPLHPPHLPFHAPPPGTPTNRRPRLLLPRRHARQFINSHNPARKPAR